jgi:hypothetical protein
LVRKNSILVSKDAIIQSLQQKIEAKDRILQSNDLQFRELTDSNKPANETESKLKSENDKLAAKLSEKTRYCEDLNRTLQKLMRIGHDIKHYQVKPLKTDNQLPEEVSILAPPINIFN